MKQTSSEKVRIRRLREQYRKRVLTVGIVLFLIGLILGLLIGRTIGRGNTDTAVDQPTANVITPIPVEDDGNDVIGFEEPDGSADENGGFVEEDGEVDVIEPTPEPTPTATPEPTPEPTPEVLAIVPFGESYTYSTEIKADGSGRMEADDDAFETVSFTQTMKSYMLPAGFAAAYGTVYKLKGNEAGAEFELTLNDYTGSASIVPQNTMVFAFEDESGETRELGYQLMNAYVGGDYGVALPTNTPKLFYKRYQYSSTGNPMKYLVVTTYVDGQEKLIKFELEGLTPAVTDVPKTYDTLMKGDKSEAVLDLQNKLVELGYLDGGADGDYGSKTETAVKLAQGMFGLEQTGVADNEFQQKLFAAQPAGAEEETTETAEN